MKIVINKCFGGFSLSPMAVKAMADRAGRPCFFFTHNSPDGGPIDFGHYYPLSVKEAQETKFGLVSAFDIPNPQEVLVSQQNWHELDQEGKKASNELYRKHRLDDRDVPRDNADLVAVVEQLGNEASGQCAELGIVEIPDGAEWSIEEYDGNEHVAESHRIWR